MTIIILKKVTFELGKDVEKDVFPLVTSGGTKNIFPYFYAEFKIDHLSYSIYSISKHDAIDMADPSSVQDACHIWTSWWPCSPQSLFDLVVEHRSTECEGLRFDNTWRLRRFSLFHARRKTENIYH